MVPPGGEIRVPVVFRPGGQSGRVRIGFGLHTTPDHPGALSLALIADVRPRVEIVRLGGAPSAIRPGESATQVLEVRRMLADGEGGPGEPEFAVDDGLRAAVESSTTEPATADAPGRICHRVRVELASALPAGRYQGTLRASWADGVGASTFMSWEVRAPIRVDPAGLLIAGGDPGRRRVVVRSDGGPFRILRAEGPIAAHLAVEGLPTSASALHRLDLTARPGASPPTGTHDLILATDHPAQDSVRLTIHVMGEAGR